MADENQELNLVVKRALTRAVKRFKDALTEQALKGKITEQDLDGLDFGKKSRLKARDEQCFATGGLISQSETEHAGSSDSPIYQDIVESTQKKFQEYMDKLNQRKKDDEP